MKTRQANDDLNHCNSILNLLKYFQSIPTCLYQTQNAKWFQVLNHLISPFQNYLSDMTFMAAEVLPQTLHNKIDIVMVISLIHVV